MEEVTAGHARDVVSLMRACLVDTYADEHGVLDFQVCLACNSPFDVLFAIASNISRLLLPLC